ncbi:MAG: hypothetical protein WDA16_11410 [Candidatus Thermoplasmatota archaeon]
MLSATPTRAHDILPTTDVNPEPVAIDAPEYLVERFLQLTTQRKQLDDQLAYVRAELELLAAPALKDTAAPRGRFLGPAGTIHVRLQPTCVFDRAPVAARLQKEGVLSEVATIAGPTLARYLRSNGQVAARLGDAVRFRNSVVLTTMGP